MYRLILLLLFCCSYFNGHCQNNACADTIKNYYYSWPGLIFETNIHYLSDNNNNSILQVDSINQSAVPNIEFIKFDKDNRFLYRKTFLQQNLINPFQYDLAFTNSENSIIYCGGSYYNSQENTAVIAKFDSSGNMKLHKKYDQSGNTDGFYIRKSIEGKNNDIIALSYFNINDRLYKLSVLDSNGNVLWAKSYTSLNTQIFPNDNSAVTFNGDEIVLTGEFIYGADNKNGFFICRINYQTGNIIESKSFSFANNQNAWPYYHLIGDFRFDSISQTYMLLIWTDERMLTGFTGIIFDNQLNIIKAKNFDHNGLYTIAGINAYNTIAVSWPQYSDTSVLYAIIDSKLEIIAQKKIKINSIAPIHNPSNYISKFIIKNNNQFNILTSSYDLMNGDDIVLTGNSQYYNINNTCFGYDTSFIFSQDIVLVPLNIAIDKETVLQIVATDLPLLFPAESQLQMLETCREISICDSFKLTGQSQHCLSNPYSHFKIYKNPLCKRKTYWQSDTSAMQIISKTDTSLDVKFLQPYRGYLYAGISGCVLKDSIWIEVYAPKSGVNLGTDIIFCPGKNLLLDAGNGFKNYQWQDGSNQQAYSVNSPGQYEVTVTDSCNNVFADTILVNPLNIQLKADYPSALCLFDTAIIFIPAAFHNITWQPSNNGLLTNNQLKLFPPATSLYTISGEIFPGCNLTDTTLIKVNICPIYIYFPTAFTPNNDGINDTYKPSVLGRFLQYELIIYNRWGQVVFKTNTPNNGWNGSYKAGLPIMGSYIFTCSYRFMNELPQFKKGSFTLIN